MKRMLFATLLVIVVAVSASATGSIVAWGWNSRGQCDMPSSNTGFVQLASDYDHNVGLKSDSSVTGWGWNDYGQCDVPSPSAGFVEVAAGYAHSLGLKSDGSVVCWGDNGWGQCDIPSPNTDFVSVAAGWDKTAGVKSDGSIVCWGMGLYGECEVPSPNSGFVSVAVGEGHMVGLKSNGSVVCWGRNDYGQCGVPAPNSGFAAVAAGHVHSAGLKSDGSVVCWGYNYEGECNVPSPNERFVQVAAGGYHTVGLKSDCSVVCWGSDLQGQCDVPLPNSGFVGIAAGDIHSVGLKSGTPTSLSLQAASLRVTIDPPNAVSEGGRWRRAGTEPWLESGQTEANVPVGVYRIEFKDLPLWVTLGELIYLSPCGTDVVLEGYCRYHLLGEVKGLPDGTSVSVRSVAIGAWDSLFYVEAEDRSSGIRVAKEAHGVSEGDMVIVAGTVATEDGETRINATDISIVSSGDELPRPLGTRQRSFYDGLNNIGLLIKTWGRVTDIGPDYLYIDDGSKLSDGTGSIGIRVICDPAGYSPGDFLAVTGISSCFRMPTEDIARRILTRSPADVRKIALP